MRLNTTDLGLVETFSLISDIKKLSFLVETGLMENLSLEEFSVRESDYPDECIKEAELWALKDFRERIFTSQLRYGIILSSYSITESQLRMVYRLFLKRRNLSDARKLIKSKGNSYSKIECLRRKIDSFEINPKVRWTKFNFLNNEFKTVRNCIAHDGGVVQAKDRCIIENSDFLSISKSEMLLIEGEFLEKIFGAVTTFFNDLCEDLGFLVNNQRKEIGIKEDPKMP